MKNIGKLSVLVLSLVVLLSIAGCNSTPPPSVVTNVPQSCTLNVYSQCLDCYGYVWINGLSTGKYLDTNGAQTFTGLQCGAVISIELRDENGYISTPRIITLSPGQNILTFSYW